MGRFSYLLCAVALCVVAGCGLLVEEGREVLAKVDGEPVRLNDLLRRIRELPFEERTKTNDDDRAARLEARRRVLKSLVFEKLLAKEAAARGIKIADKDAEAVLVNQREAQASATGNLVEGIKGAASSHEHAHGDERPSRGEIRQMAERMMIEKLLSEQVSETVAQKYYDGHAQEFVVSPPLLSYELIVVDVSNRKFIDTISQKAAKDKSTLAAAILSLPNRPPLVFAGMTPLVPLSGVVPTMREKVESLKVGEVSKPFSLRQGTKDHYGVARLVSYFDTMPFEHVKKQIGQKLYQEFLAEIEKKHKVVYHEDKLDYRLNE
ncbi:SurA N-terminal domain-containing protein [Candidatus Poribacteria bacterium]|nr:SurA N-terminal domain-containing protein [Candidatus Poribacteria bacterium]